MKTPFQQDSTSKLHDQPDLVAACTDSPVYDKRSQDFDFTKK